jgi:glutaredoxin
MHYKVYSKEGCVYCDKAKKEIGDRGETYDEEILEKQTLEGLLGRKVTSYPVVMREGKYIGGYSDLVRLWLREEDLDSEVF